MINTLDLDEIEQKEFQRIIEKIKKNKCCLNLTWKYSNSKGYHVYIYCSKICDLCRFVFDDEKRYAVDSVMPLKFRDFLFDEKIYFGNKRITKENLEKAKKLKIEGKKCNNKK